MWSDNIKTVEIRKFHSDAVKLVPSLYAEVQYRQSQGQTDEQIREIMADRLPEMNEEVIIEFKRSWLDRLLRREPEVLKFAKKDGIWFQQVKASPDKQVRLDKLMLQAD